jgi:erythrin-vacuolar iron transport family protein
MDQILMEAIATAITIENRSLDFYRAATSKATNANTKRVFELLAKEEADHVEYLCNLCGGNRGELTNTLSTHDVFSDPGYCKLFAAVDSDINEKDALQIALKEEQACIEWYTGFTQTIREPHVRDVFIRILNETNKHSELIEEEYMRVMHMVDRTDQDIYVRE